MSPSTSLSDGDIARLLDTCAGTTLAGMRDRAILQLFVETGAELLKIAELRFSAARGGRPDVDIESGIVWFTGIDGTRRATTLGDELRRAMERYALARERLPTSSLDAFWITPRRAFTAEDVAVMVRRRGRRAGVGDAIHPHHHHD